MPDTRWLSTGRGLAWSTGACLALACGASTHAMQGADPWVPAAPGSTTLGLDAPAGLDLTTAPRSRQPAWGTDGSTWITFGAGASNDFDELSDINITGAWSKFLATDFELMLELAIREFDMPGDDPIAINPAIVFRQHWRLDQDGDWGVYLDAGIGLMLSTDDVPNTGTSFNFTPRVGSGLTYQLTDNWRLIAGLRWSHISNARIFGSDDNPASDGVMFSIGLSTPLSRLLD